MIDVENKEGRRQAIVSKDTEGMNHREGLAGSVRVLAGAMPWGPGASLQARGAGRWSWGVGRAQVKGGLGH